MKLKFNLKNKEASFDMDAEKLIEKKMDINSSKEHKTRFQIKEEEKRKTLELKERLKQEARERKHQEDMTKLKYLGIAYIVLMTLAIIMGVVFTLLGVE